MDRDKLMDRLREHFGDINRFGVKSLALFGSAARNEASECSDVDILAEFDGPVTFDSYMGLKLYLEDLLGIPVDLATSRSLKPRIRERVKQEAVVVA